MTVEFVVMAIAETHLLVTELVAMHSAGASSPARSDGKVSRLMLAGIFPGKVSQINPQLLEFR